MACLLGGLREPADQNLGVAISNEVRAPTCNVDLGREHIGSGCKRRDKTSVADRIGDEEGAPDGDAGTLHGGRQAKAHVSQDKTARLGALEPKFPEPIGPTPFTQWV